MRLRYGVPAGLCLIRRGAHLLVFAPGDEEAVSRAAEFGSLPVATAQGRSALRRVASARGNLLVREVRKGGALRGIRGRWFRGAYRPLAELVLLLQLRDRGVPVVEGVGCVLLLRPWGWRGLLLTREVASSCDLGRWLDGAQMPLARREVLRRAGSAARRLHDAGVQHGDLHPQNFLLTSGGEVLLLDLDKAKAHAHPLSREGRMENLARLCRAILKRGLQGSVVPRRDLLRFLEGYTGDPRDARQWLAVLHQRLLRRRRWRTLWWRWRGQIPRGKIPLTHEVP